MAVSRRQLIAAAATLPVLLVLRSGLGAAGDLLAGAVRTARPGPDGTSATRCAQCGSPDHTMLSPLCPLAPKVLS